MKHPAEEVSHKVDLTVNKNLICCEGNP